MEERVFRRGRGGEGAEPITAQLDTFHLAAELELGNALHLKVVPDHNFVLGVLRALAAADEGEDVGAKEHLNNANATVVKLCAMLRDRQNHVRY